MKKNASNLIMLLTFLVLNACSSIAGSQPQSDVIEKTVIGHYIYGHEVNSFQPCNEKEVFWVNGSNRLLELMAKKYSDFAAQPYDEVFVEIIGNFEDRASDGFAMDYDGQIYVMKMVHKKKKIDTDCK